MQPSRHHFEFMQITLIFHAFFDEVEKKISDGSTAKFILYVKKRLHAKIGACIRPVTINTLSDLTKTVWFATSQAREINELNYPYNHACIRRFAEQNLAVINYLLQPMCTALKQ